MVIIGTIHDWHYSHPHFSMNALKSLLVETKPDVILAELSKEQLTGTMTSSSKPEYDEVILPFVEENGIECIPIQPDTEVGLRYGENKRRVLDVIEIDPDLRVVFAFIDSLWKVINGVEKSVCEIQSRQAEYLFKYIDQHVHKALIEPYWNCTETWNRMLYENIKLALSELKQSRIVITIGIRHKYWMAEKLASSQGILLENTEKYCSELD